jgi:AraC-like DNA-binding protein
MQLQITTEEVPESNRFEAWSDAIFNTFAISVQPLSDTKRPFRGRLSARASGPLLNCTLDADGYRASRHSRELAHRHFDSYWIGREYSTGALHEIGGQELLSKPGDMVVGDADAAFVSRPADQVRHELWLVPKALVDPHLPARNWRPFISLSARSGVDALAASYLDTLNRNWDSIPETAMARVTDTLCRLIGIACGASMEEQPDAVRAGRLVEAKRHIELHLADQDLSPAGVAAALGISVRSLHLLFEPTGTSFARHVLRGRLAECRMALLASPTRQVTDIAFAWGFNNLSSFYRAFQAAYGMSPGDLREMSRYTPQPDPVALNGKWSCT